ncbi:tetratricopeptide repeat protein [Methylopila sp. M107]|uniref:tetratricopeptide repeat protein n=1 Tax=Methylopila sp. M107 TaxID=1101190 RepID=UPI0012DE7A62|nr:tetratricopeptide repeat protein [Methylopila sp. M107]
MLAALVGAPSAHADDREDAAIQAFRTSLAGNYLAGRVAGADRNATAAAAYFRAALRDDPRNTELLERSFLLTLAEGDGDGAMRLAERVVASDPSNRIARLALAARALRTHNYSSARHHLAQGAKGPLAELTVQLITGWTWLGSDQRAKALEAVDKLQGADFFGTFRDYHAAIIADIGGDKVEAAKRFNAAIAGDNAALRIVQATAIFKAQQGDKAGALKTIADFEKTAPRHPIMRETREMIEKGGELKRPVKTASEGAAEVLYGIGGALARQGGEDLSVVYLQLALYLEPEHPMALVTLGDLYDQLNQFADAIKVYERVPASSPLKRNAEIQAAMDLDRLDKTDEAIAALKKIIAQSPDDQEAVVALGNVQRSREKFAEAAETYTRAIELATARKPSEPEAPVAAPAAAPAPAAEAVAPAPAPVAAVAQPAVYTVKAGDSLWKIAAAELGDGKRWLELRRLNRSADAAKAVGRRLRNPDVLQVGQGLLLRTDAEATPPQQSESAQAPAASPPTPQQPQAPAPVAPAPVAPQAAGQPDRSNWSLYYVRGIAYERSKQWAKAEPDLKLALELAPDQALIMNYLGYSWIDQGINLDEGMKLIKRAVELKPDDGYIVDSLGWAHYRLGKYEDAVRELERAVELRPQDPVMNDHLGDAYWRVGRRTEARFQWSHAKDLKPEAAELPKIEAKLKDGLSEEQPKTNAADNGKREGG